MPVRFVALFLTLCLTTILSSVTFAAAPVVEPTGVWSGKIKDGALRKLASQSSFIADAAMWKKVWTAWRPEEDLPRVDFTKELILVGTVPGPNLAVMRPTIDESGDVRFSVGGTKIGGPGFGYKLVDEFGVEKHSHKQGKNTETTFFVGAKLEPRQDRRYYITVFILKDGKRTHIGEKDGKRGLCKVLTQGNPCSVMMIVRSVR